jgi:hypothetical protein
MEKQLEVKLHRQPSFKETWYEGSVTFDGQEHQFWLIDPDHSDYEPEVRWFFQKVPMEVRKMYNNIITFYLENKNKNENDTGKE